MKFHESHRLDILKSFVNVGLTKDQFSFTKKKGRIKVEHNESKAWFSYFHKADFAIDKATGLSVDGGYWEVKTSANTLIKVGDWSKVNVQLDVWLSQL